MNENKTCTVKVVMQSVNEQSQSNVSNNIHRLHLQVNDHCLKELHRFIRDSLIPLYFSHAKTLKFKCTYMDDEGDCCLITSNQELLVAFEVAHRQEKQLKVLVKLVVTTEEKETIQENTEDMEYVQVGHQQDPASDVVSHTGVTCDACQMSPIVGMRYKCVQCDNFDLCSECESKSNGQYHPVAHSMLKMRVPYGVVCNCTLRAQSCESESTVESSSPTQQGGLVCRWKCLIPELDARKPLLLEPNQRLDCLLHVENSKQDSTVPETWQLGTRIVIQPQPQAASTLTVHLYDDKEQEVSVLPGEIVAGQSYICRLSITAPAATGDYSTLLQLQTPDHVPFGEHFMITVTVTPEKIRQLSLHEQATLESKQTESKPKSSSTNSTEPPAFAFQTQLNRMLEMGFQDVNLIKYLLCSNKGNEQVVAEFLLKAAPAAK